MRRVIVMGNPKFIVIDLSNGELSSVVNAGVIVRSEIPTPWRGALRLHEAGLAAGENTRDEASSRLVAMGLTCSSVQEWCGVPRSTGAQSAAGQSAFTLQKAALIPRWRDTAEMLMAELNPVLVTDAAREIKAPPGLSFLYPVKIKDTQLQYLLLSLRAELEEGCPAGRLFGESLATTLAVHLVCRYAVFPGKIVEYRGGLPVWRLRSVVDYIEAHLGEEVTLRQLAELAHMSKYYFGHLFKQSTGLSPHQFFLRQRIAKAKSLLVDDRLSLVEISHSVGFASQTHFTTVFRKLVGTTPLAYRNRR
jgi:AraC family transcriptional regulator